MKKFTRPSSLTFPQTYYTFKAKDSESEALVDYRIQDLPEEDYERALDLLLSAFVPEENLCVCRDVPSDSVAMKELRAFWEKELNSKISIACYKNNDESNVLVGLNVLAVKSKDEDCSSDKVC